MPGWLASGLAIVIAFVPKLVLALVILIVGLIVARLISRALSKLLTRVGFDRLVERGGVAKALANSKLDASGIIAKIVYYALVLFVLQFAFGVFGPNPISTLLGTIIALPPAGRHRDRHRHRHRRDRRRSEDAHPGRARRPLLREAARPTSPASASSSSASSPR